MANAISQLSPVFESTNVRIVQDADQLWFAAQDVMDCLDYSGSYKPATALGHVPEEWKGVYRIHTPGGKQKLLCLSEPGLYFFLGRSDKPKALPFQKWLAGEVLPSIRKTGRYSMQPDLIDASRHETLNELVARLARQLAEPNGYCVQTFMPLYEEICKQLGKKAQRAPSVKQPGFYKALEASNALASAVQIAAMQALMEGGQLKAGRWAMNINEHEGMGRGVHVKPMPLNAIMAAPEDWPRLITEPNGNYFSKETLTLIMNACLNKLLDYLDCTQQSNEMLRTELKRRKALPA